MVILGKNGQPRTHWRAECCENGTLGSEGLLTTVSTMAVIHNISILLLLSLVTSYAMAFSYSSWLVLVTVKCDKKTDRCLGAVVADDYVVTAARCFNRCSKTDSTIRVYTELSRSSKNTVTLGDKMKRTEVTIHPNYTSSSHLNDIALIKIDCLSSNIVRLQPVDSCSLFNDANEYTFCDLSKRKTLLEYNVTRSRKKACTKEYSGNFMASEMLCFKKSQCSDNTVGLAVRENKLFALSSFGLECQSDGEKTYASFASLDVCMYSSWIQSEISKEGNVGCNGSVGDSTTAPPTTVPATTQAPTTANPTTDEVGCPELRPFKYGSVSYTRNFAIFTCNAGYLLKGKDSSACKNGKWKPDPPTCEPILCPALDGIPNGQVRLTGNTVGSAAIYTCSDGYTLEGYQKRRCNENGDWEGTPPTCHLTKTLFCEHPGSIPCGTTALTGSLTDGSKLTFTPADGVQLVGATTITCKDGKWSDSMPKCRYMCDEDFKIKNGKYRLEFEDDTTDYKLIITCKEGYTNTFYDEYLCTGGSWAVRPHNAKCVGE